MSIALIILATLYGAVLVGYFNALKKLHAVVQSERPEWLPVGRQSIFYSGLPRLADPNVSIRAIGVAFSNRAHQLQSPNARCYALSVRALLLSGVLLLGAMFLYATH